MKKISFSALLIVFIILQSCVTDNNEPVEPPKDTPRTILVYMIASNSLGSSGYDKADFEEMNRAVKNEDLNHCRILVYHVQYQSISDPQLIEIRKEGENVVHRELKRYSSSVKSTTIERMSEVYADVRSLAPAKDYGLILWSHASGWALNLSRASRTSILKNSIPLYRNFGEDSNAQMQLDELATAIPNDMFSFIYVDACYMAGIEEAYQLRNKTDYYIGSSALLPAAGMPYDLNLPEFCKPTPDLVQACKNTFNYYNSMSGSSRTLTISLTDCSELDNMADICQKIYSTSEEITDLSEMQGYIIPSEAKCIYFDFGQYVNKRATSNLAATFNEVLNRTVIYKATTGNIFNQLIIDTNKFSGLSSYIMGTSTSANEQYYKSLDWYKATHK